MVRGWSPRSPHAWLQSVTASLLLLPALAGAQATPMAHVRDSARAVTTACEVVRALRPPADRHTCRVESFRDTPTEYVVRIREDAPPTAKPLAFKRSEVRLAKAERSVIVTRVPDF
jgi:hypothetical protein